MGKHTVKAPNRCSPPPLLHLRGHHSQQYPQPPPLSPLCCNSGGQTSIFNLFFTPFHPPSPPFPPPPANFTLPEPGDFLDSVLFVELQRDEAAELVRQYNEEGRKAGPPPEKRFDGRPSPFRGRGGGGGGFQRFDGRGAAAAPPPPQSGGSRGGFQGRGGGAGGGFRGGGGGGGGGGGEDPPQKSFLWVLGGCWGYRPLSLELRGPATPPPNPQSLTACLGA